MGTVIGIAGAVRGCGCTHFVLSLASGIRKQNRNSKIAVMDKTASDWIRCLGEELGELDASAHGDYFRYHGVDYYLKDFGIAAYREYDFVVMDCGTDLSDEYYRSDICVLVVPSRTWSRGSSEVYKACGEIDKAIGLNNITIISPFADKTAQKELKHVLTDSTLYFTDYEADPVDDPVFNASLIIGKQAKKGLFGFRSKPDVSDEDEDEQDPSVSSIPERGKPVRELPVKTDVSEEPKAEETKAEEPPASEPAPDNPSFESLMKDWIQLQMMNSMKGTVPAQAPEPVDADELTGLPTRRTFKKTAQMMDESGKGYAVIFFDVNNLKQTNDTLGHDKGDILITTVAKEIKKYFPELYRVGGDEFNSMIPVVDFRASLLDEIDASLKRITEEDKSGIVYEVAHGYALSTEALTLSDVMALADKRMYEDKKRKKSVKTVLTGDHDEIIADDHRINADIPAPAETSPFSIDNTIAGTLPFGDDEPFRKTLDTMWFTKIDLSYEHGKYHETKLYVFATEYQKPPLPVNSIVVAEDNGDYVFSFGKNNIIRVGNSVFMVNARFSAEGRLTVGVIPQNDEIKIVDRTNSDNAGAYTPKHFGLVVRGYEVYPIKKNIDGLCDCILLKDNDVYLSSGLVDTGNEKYEIVLNEDSLNAVPVI